MKRVEFLINHSIYNAGEVAGFEDAAADRLVSTKKARYADGRSPAAQPQPQGPPVAPDVEVWPGSGHKALDGPSVDRMLTSDDTMNKAGRGRRR